MQISETQLIANKCWYVAKSTIFRFGLGGAELNPERIGQILETIPEANAFLVPGNPQLTENVSRSIFELVQGNAAILNQSLVQMRTGMEMIKEAGGGIDDCWGQFSVLMVPVFVSLQKLFEGDFDGYKEYLAQLCGLPPEADKIQIAHQELRQLVSSLEPYVEGLVWNPYSPNTAALKMLRTPEEFKHSAEIITDCAPEKPIFVKMGPYEDCPEEQDPWLKLANAWMQGGGTGFVAVNTKMVPANKVPLKEWGYPSAGKSGKALQDYRRRAISDLRKTFPDAEIIATGGIDSGNEAWDSFSRGANVVAGYTPYIFEGFGLQRNIAREIQNNLSLLNYDTLVEFQANKYRL